MTARQVFEEVALTLPHSIDEKLLLIWLTRVEQYAALGIEELDCNALPTITDAQLDDELRIPNPHSSVYSLYLQCMIHLAMGEYDRYSALYKFFNSAFSDYAKWHQRTGR